MKELPAGADAVLLDFADEPSPAQAVRHTEAVLRRALSAGQLGRVTDIVPSASTIMVQFDVGSAADTLTLARALRAGRTPAVAEADHDRTIAIPVTYDGHDLDDVARQLGCLGSDVARLHTRTRWRVQFMGFAPGFGYLVPEDEPDSPLTRVGRRAEPRTTVPTGAVAVAAGYSAVYPRSSPGGWNLLGHTDIRLWDETSASPSLLTPGTLVSFVPTPDRS